MIARISTTLPCTDVELWEKIVQPASLQYISAPLIKFKPAGNTTLPQEWQMNKPFNLNLYFLNFIPLGRHQITLVDIDKSANRIVSNETGLMTPIWIHSIQFEKNDEKTIYYTDAIEIKAGLRTPLIWLFAHWFYRHRQRRWKKLLS